MGKLDERHMKILHELRERGAMDRDDFHDRLMDISVPIPSEQIPLDEKNALDYEDGKVYISSYGIELLEGWKLALQLKGEEGAQKFLEDPAVRPRL